VWKEEETKRVLMGGVMTLAEVMTTVVTMRLRSRVIVAQVLQFAGSEASVGVGSAIDDESEAAAAAAAEAAAAAANSVTVGQFMGWLLSTAASARGGAYSGDTSTDAGSSPDSMLGRPNTAYERRSEQQKHERSQLRNLLSQIKEGVLDVIQAEAAKYALRRIV
jgi:hypothetical protein